MPNMKCYQVLPCLTTQPTAADWANARPLTDFSLPWENRPAPRTEFRALWTQSHLHFAFTALDSIPVLGPGSTLKDRVLDSDRVEIFLAPDLDLKPYYCLEISPDGVALTYRARHYREMDWVWQCPGLEARAVTGQDSFEVIGSLPWSALRELSVLKPGTKQFYAGLYRADFAIQPDGSLRRSWMPWVNPGTERADFHVPGSFGILELIDWDEET